MLQLKRFTGSLTVLVFTMVSVFSNSAFAFDASIASLPVAGELLSTSDDYTAPLMKGLVFDPQNPLSFKFIFDTVDEHKVTKEDSERMIRYFLAGLTLNEKSLWVNLSPYEADRVMEDTVASTEVGREMLAQDYLLKQLSASLTYPETKIGQQFWQNDANADSLSKIWIKPENALIYEHKNIAMIKDASLTVESEVSGSNSLLPTIKEEVNSGANFAQLRQLYHSMILAQWFKAKFRNSFYKQYFNKEKVNNLDLVDESYKQEVYNKYVEAFKKGVYDYIRKETNQAGYKQKKHYFCGGIDQDTTMTSAVSKVNEEELSTVVPEGNFIAANVNIHRKTVPSWVKVHKSNVYFDGAKVTDVVTLKDPNTEISVEELVDQILNNHNLPGRKRIVVQDKETMTTVCDLIAFRLMEKYPRQFTFGDATGGTGESARMLQGISALLQKYFHFDPDYGKIKGVVTLDNYTIMQHIAMLRSLGASEELITALKKVVSYKEEQEDIHLRNMGVTNFFAPNISENLTPRQAEILFRYGLNKDFTGSDVDMLFQLLGIGADGHIAFNASTYRHNNYIAFRNNLVRESNGINVKHAFLRDGTDLVNYGLETVPAYTTLPKHLLRTPFRDDHATQIPFIIEIQNVGYWAGARPVHKFFLQAMTDNDLYDRGQFMDWLLSNTVESLMTMYNDSSLQFSSMFHFVDELKYIFAVTDKIGKDAITQGTYGLTRRLSYPLANGNYPLAIMLASGPWKQRPLETTLGFMPNTMSTTSRVLGEIPNSLVIATEDAVAGLSQEIQDTFIRVHVDNVVPDSEIRAEWAKTKGAKERLAAIDVLKDPVKNPDFLRQNGGVLMNTTKVMDIEASDEVVDIEVEPGLFDNLSFEIISHTKPDTIYDLI